MISPLRCEMPRPSCGRAVRAYDAHRPPTNNWTACRCPCRWPAATRPDLRLPRTTRPRLRSPWRAAEDETEAQTLPLMRVGDSVEWVSGTIDHRVTKPPSRFTDGTLIAAMSSVHKLVTDPKIKARLKETSGLGTEATRANIIETLLKREFIERKGKQVISTERGRLLVAALPEVLTDPGITGLWEDALSEVAAGTRTLQDFEERQRAFVTKRVEAAKAGAALALPASAKPVQASSTKKRRTFKKRTAK